MKVISLFVMFLLLLSACSRSFERKDLIGAWHLTESRVNSSNDTSYTEHFWAVTEFSEDTMYHYNNLSESQYPAYLRQGKYQIDESGDLFFKSVKSSSDTFKIIVPIIKLTSSTLIISQHGTTNTFEKIENRKDYFTNPVSPPHIIEVDTTSSN